jgi:hypothetical protein
MQDKPTFPATLKPRAGVGDSDYSCSSLALDKTDILSFFISQSATVRYHLERKPLVKADLLWVHENKELS